MPLKKWIFSIITFSLFSNECLSSILFKWDQVHHEEVSSFLGAPYLKVKGMSLEGFNGLSLQKLQSGFSFMEKVINSEEFRSRVINFKNKRGERKFESNRGLSNEEIYEIFMEGREVLQMDTPGEVNLFLKLYDNPMSRVIGYTTSKTNLININWKYFKHFKIHEVAANLTHEWTHKLGFGHTSAKEHDSVPYAIGYIVRDLVLNSMNHPGPIF